MTAENIEKSGRFTALDGLRGLAAMVVVIHHALRTNPAFGSLEGQLGPGDWSWWLLNTPFRLVWAGPEAVLVFFVLSGFVLTLAALRASAGFWRAYYPQRLIRLYLPVWGALVATLVLAWAIPRNAAIGDSVWLASSDVAATRRTLLKDFTLTNPSLLDGPLWSLRIEVLFSMLLPLYVVVALRLRRFAMPLALAAAVATAAGRFGYLRFLPVFAIGCLMAVHRDALTAWVARLTGWTGWATALTAALLLTVQGWSPLPYTAGMAVSVLAAATLVLLFMGWQPALRLARTRPVRWLGSISFSLYLVHEPILVTFGFVAPLWTVLMVGVPLALLAAHLFYRAVEGPSHRLSQWVNRRMRASGQRLVLQVETPGASLDGAHRHRARRR